MKANIQRFRKRRSGGIAMVVALLFIAVFSSLSVALLSVSSTNAQVAANHRGSNEAMSAAMSGVELAKYLIDQTPTFSTSQNVVTDAQANQIWQNFCSTVQTQAVGGVTGQTAETFTDGSGSGQQIYTGDIAYGPAGETMNVRFYRYDSDPRTLYMESIGSRDVIQRKIQIGIEVKKQADVLNYAIASRGRMWVTQNSIIHGPIYSTWNRPDVGAGVETTADTVVEGTINTIISREDLENHGIQMETLDEDGNPMYDEYGDRIVSPQDAIQGEHEGINYEVDTADMPGMQPQDYDTSMYKSMCSDIGSYDAVQREYFPHVAGNYGYPSSSSSKRLDRKVYRNRTFSNVRIPKGTHALFENCTFENVLFVESNETYYDSTSTTNNVRFDNCNFNGAIVTDVPSTSQHYSWWMRNVLYFTGEANFQNESAFQETTILAPNFNVNLGNTGEFEQNGGNVLTGAIVGGIVDVRGNAQIYGTIISMYDTSNFSSGYITNIGAADDGGSESAGYVGGTIEITPNPAQLLPSGIQTPIVIEPQFSTYKEVACGA